MVEYNFFMELIGDSKTTMASTKFFSKGRLYKLMTRNIFSNMNYNSCESIYNFINEHGPIPTKRIIKFIKRDERIKGYNMTSKECMFLLLVLKGEILVKEEIDNLRKTKRCFVYSREKYPCPEDINVSVSQFITFKKMLGEFK